MATTEHILVAGAQGSDHGDFSLVGGSIRLLVADEAGSEPLDRHLQCCRLLFRLSLQF